MFSKFNKFNFILITLSITGFKLYSMEIADIENLNNSLFDSITKRDLAGVRQAIQVGADVKSVKGFATTPLYIATVLGELSIVKELLIYGAEVNTRFLSPLMVAIEGNLDITRELLFHGANVNTSDSCGRTVLMEACRFPQLEIVKFLLAYGADVNAKRHEGIDGVTNDDSSIGETALSKVIARLDSSQKFSKEIIKYLAAAGANIEYSLDKAYESIKNCEGELKATEKIGYAADSLEEGKRIFKEIFSAAKNRDVNKIIEIVNDGYPLNIQDEFGNTPIHYAIRNNDRAMIYVILHRPYGQRLLYRENNDGQTPLHLLADHHELLQWLLAKFFGEQQTVYEG